MSTKVVTGKVRFSFVNVWEPRVEAKGADPKYSITMIIPKEDTSTMKAIRAACAEARETFCRKNGPNSLPAKPTTTIYDGDGLRPKGQPFGPECKGCWVVGAKSKHKPLLIDAQKRDITDPGEIYSGCYGRAIISFYGYNNTGNMGIAAGLEGLMKLHDGDPLAGGHASADEFDNGWTDSEAETDDSWM